MKGINRNNLVNKFFDKNNKTCVFISHKSEDKNACKRIAEYLEIAGLDVYLDCNDLELQTASLKNDVEAVTNCIKDGIRNSTHMLCVLSKRTVHSKWVPFEIGYAHSTLIDKDLNVASKKWRISILRLDGLEDSQLPEYLQIAPDVKGINEFNSYVQDLLNSSELRYIMEDRIIKAFNAIGRQHPLEGVLSFKY